MQSGIEMLAGFNAFANEILYDVCTELDDAEYRRDRKAFFGSIHNTLNHLLLVDRLWIARLLGYEPQGISSLDQILYDDFDDLRTARVAEDQKLLDLVSQFDESRLSEVVEYTRMTGEFRRETKNEMFFTLFTHQTHHRGQVHAMLTQCDKKIPDMDLVDYLDKQAA